MKLPKGPTIAIAALTLLALAVRVYTTCWTGLATDEANGIMLSISGSWPDMVQHLKEDGAAPLLSVLIRIYSMAFGHGDMSMRIFSITLATLQVPVSYLICRRFLTPGASLQVAAMIALSATLVRFSTMIRPYALMSIFSLLSTWLCIEVLRRKSLLWALAYGVTTALLVYSHYWGGFVPLGQAVLVIVGLLWKWFDLKAARCWFLGAALSALLFLPWVPIFLYQIHHNLSVWIDRPQAPSDLVMAFASNIFVGPTVTANPFDQSVVLNSLVLLLSVLILAASPKTPTSDIRHWKVVALASYGIALILCCVVSALRQRYLTVFTPLFAIVYGSSAALLLPPASGLMIRLLPVLVWLPLWLPQYVINAKTPETSTPAIAAQITRYADRKKDLVLITTPTIAPAVTFYLPEDITVITMPDLDRRNFNRWDVMFERMKDPRLVPEVIIRMEQTLAGGGKIWLVARGHDIHAADFMDQSRVKILPYLSAEAYRSDQILTWLSVNADQVGGSHLAPGRDWDVVLSEFIPRE